MGGRGWPDLSGAGNDERSFFREQPANQPATKNITGFPLRGGCGRDESRRGSEVSRIGVLSASAAACSIPKRGASEHDRKKT